jgi:hypothetical protein
VPKVVNREPPDYQVGQRQTFWLVDLTTNRPFSVEAALCLVTPHAYFYLEEGCDLPGEDLEQAG